MSRGADSSLRAAALPGLWSPSHRGATLRSPIAAAADTEIAERSRRWWQPRKRSAVQRGHGIEFEGTGDSTDHGDLCAVADMTPADSAELVMAAPKARRQAARGAGGSVVPCEL